MNPDDNIGARVSRLLNRSSRLDICRFVITNNAVVNGRGNRGRDRVSEYTSLTLEEERKNETKRGRQSKLKTEIEELGGATERSVTHGTPRVWLAGQRVCRKFFIEYLYIFHGKMDQHPRVYTKLIEQTPVTC